MRLRQQQQQQQMRGGGAGGMPGSDFVVRAFEDGLRALNAQQQEEEAAAAAVPSARRQQGPPDQDQFELMTRLAEVSARGNWGALFVPVYLSIHPQPPLINKPLYFLR